MTQPGDDDRPSSLDNAKQELVAAGMVLARLGHGDMTRGHVSVRHPSDASLILMKPHSIGLDEITPAAIQTIDLDGIVVDGGGRRHSEVFIHTEIYRARPDVGAVVHSHPVHSVALASSGRPLRPLCQGGALFAGHLGSFEQTMDLIRSPASGRALAEALGPHQAVLMRCHGVAMTGRTVAEAVVGCVMLEDAARVQLLAEAAGGLPADFPPDDVAALRAQLMNPDQHAINFAYLRRRLCS